MTPSIAIIDHNTLAAIGLKSILQNVIPVMRVDVFGSFAELTASEPESYFHYFVSMDIMLPNMDFFSARRHKTIILTLSLDCETSISNFHTICINQPEKQLVKALLALEQGAHMHGRNRPIDTTTVLTCPLSTREIEVMSLIVQGYINKEVADKLNISLSTVITHRKNIMEKLNIKSVSALTIYAVTRGYVDINRI